MGQQQLYVYLLVIFVVGFATVVAINTLREGYVNANRDAVREDIYMALQNAQQYYLTHKMMDGGGRSFDGITISRIGHGAETQNGTYAVSGSGHTITIEGWGNYDDGIYVKAVGTMHSDGQMTIEWAYEEEDV